MAFCGLEVRAGEQVEYEFYCNVMSRVQAGKGYDFTTEFYRCVNDGTRRADYFRTKRERAEKGRREQMRLQREIDSTIDSYF